MTAFLVTGGAGFIGSNLVDRLLEQGHAVRVLDDFSTGRRENLAAARGRAEVVVGSVTDPEACRQACRDIQVVLHHAAAVSVPQSMADPAATHQVNVDGTFNLLLASRESGVRRFVFASSSAVYGESQQLPLPESQPPVPVSPYGASKAAGELLCGAFTRAFKLQTVCLRYFNVFGSRQDPNSQYAAAIPAFLGRILRGLPPVVFGDGRQSRDFVHVDDVVRANLLAATAPVPSAAILNIASGRALTVNQVIAAMNDVLGTSLAPQHAAPRPGDVRHSLADVSLARQTIGYESRLTLREGLSVALGWYRKNL